MESKRGHNIHATPTFMKTQAYKDKFKDSGASFHPMTRVSSSNPTAAGGAPVTTGKERANHKYKGKVRTKSGKIRYLYDKDGVTTASGHHGSIQNAYRSQKHAKTVTNKAAYMNAWKRREKSENAQRARNADPIRNIQRTGRKIAREGGKAIDTARKGAETQITKMKRYLGKLFG